MDDKSRPTEKDSEKNIIPVVSSIPESEEEIIDISAKSVQEQIDYLAHVVSDLDKQEQKDPIYQKVLKSDRK